MTTSSPLSTPVFPIRRNAKTPLTEHGFHDASFYPEQVKSWEAEFPGCNWGAPTGKASGFVVLDLDAKHPESLDWWREQQDIHGSVNTLEVATPSSGAHIYFRTPDGVDLKSGASQIAPGVDTRAEGGYVVIPPSLIDGNAYEVTNDSPLADLPGWLLDVWPKRGQLSRRLDNSPRGKVNATGSTLLTTPLPDGRRNVGLTSIAGYIWNRAESPQELEAELLDANARLCNPPLPDDEVLDIARSVSRYPKGEAENSDVLSWDEIQALVAHDTHTEHFKLGTADPRRRFPLPGDRAAIRHIRQRLHLIYMETQEKLGNEGILHRAGMCGFLPRQDCQRCQTSFCDGDHPRYNCRSQLHPLCMGTQARKALWNEQERLEAEEQLQISIIRLGVYDIGDDPFLWAPQIKKLNEQVHDWIKRLGERKDCPETIAHCFLGLRYDLHNGYLTIDLVALSPAGTDGTECLLGYLGEATEREVKMDTFNVPSVEKAIHTFGNLMSSAVIYDDTYSCQAFLEGLKGKRLVWSRGRFRKSPKKEESEFVSNLGQPVGRLETNSDEGKPVKGGGHLSQCPECGSTNTKYRGRVGGDWRKVKSERTGKVYWRWFGDEVDTT